MIDMNKKYRTKGGHEVRIYATDGGGDYPIHGAALIEGEWEHRRWTKTGMHILGAPTEHDLVEVVETKTVWINLDECGLLFGHRSKEEAFRWRHMDCIRTYKVELTEADIVELGDG